MKSSLIFKTGMKILTPLLLIGSLIIFWRGHQLPGGGFIGGLVAGAALAAYSFCYGKNAVLMLIRIHPLGLMFIGLACAVVSGFIGIFAQTEPFKGLWIEVAWIGKLGTPLLFDLGVYLLVAGFVATLTTKALQTEET